MDRSPHDAAPSNSRIIVYGHSISEFPTPESLTDFIEQGVVKNRSRYRYTDNKNADKIILSREGLAFGHFEILKKEKPDERDRVEYPPVRCSYIVGVRASYAAPVRLFPLGIRVSTFGRSISMSEFQQIKEQAGQIREFPN
jgi:hypothetical protein